MSRHEQLSVGELTLGGTALTATADELNKLDGATVTVAELNKLDGATITVAELNQLDGAVDGVGAVAGTGNSVTESLGFVQKTVITLEDFAIAVADAASTIGYAGAKIYDFPAGVIQVLGAVTDLDLTKSSAGVNDDWDGDFALGTAAAAGDADLTSTEADIIAKTATPQAAAGATTADGQSTATECPAILDGSTTAKDLYLNFLVDDADHDVTSTPCNLIVNGTITLHWINLGNR